MELSFIDILLAEASWQDLPKQVSAVSGSFNYFGKAGFVAFLHPALSMGRSFCIPPS